jgi:anti-anti-sigma regulatory factor
VIVEGDLTGENAAEFESQMREINSDLSRSIKLDFSALDIEDGLGIATAVNVLRELRSRTNHLAIVGAPQMLGHNLYRVGLLDGSSAIDLVDMREDEPAGF